MLGDVERGDAVALGLFGEDEGEFIAGADHAFAAEDHGVEVGALDDAGVAMEGARNWSGR